MSGSTTISLWAFQASRIRSCAIEKHWPITSKTCRGPFPLHQCALKWTAKGDGAYASPIIVRLCGIRQIISMGQSEVIGVALQDGNLLWHYLWAGLGGGMQAITPILYSDMIIVSSHGMGVTALKPVKRNGTWTVEVAWETKEVSMFLSNPVIVRDTLFGLSERSSGQFFALNANIGKVLWLGQPRQAMNTAVVKAGSILFLLDDDGQLIIAKASQIKFEPLKRYTVADSPDVGPTCRRSLNNVLF